VNLDAYEKDILTSVESGEWSSRGETTKRTKELQQILRHQNKKAISVRVNQNDIYELKKKALENSIPYQSIVQILIHQFVSNKIKLDL